MQAAIERRVAEGPLLRPEVERRSARQLRLKIADPALAKGWLAFQSRHDRRRLWPIPAGWHGPPDTELRELLARAVPSGMIRQLAE